MESIRASTDVSGDPAKSNRWRTFATLIGTYHKSNPEGSAKNDPSSPQKGVSPGSKSSFDGTKWSNHPPSSSFLLTCDATSDSR